MAPQKGILGLKLGRDITHIMFFKNYLNLPKSHLFMQIIRKTQSVCPKCIKKIKANIVEKNGKVYMLKNCKKHGKFNVLLSNKPPYYRKLTKSYFDPNKNYSKRYKRNYFNLYVTLRCNLNCPFCLTKANQGNHPEISLEKIKNLMKNWKNTKIGLWGGEPTVREDLPEIIKIIKKSGNIPALYTNGIKISDFNYLKKLRANGLEIIHLQFDSFNDKVYKKLRNQPLIKTKLRALGNIKKLNIPVVFETTFVKGINENEMIDILNYALENNFIKAILFRSYSHLGRKGFNKENELLGEELIDILEKQTNERISNKKILEFQKLLYIFYDLISTKRCFYNQYLLIHRKQNKDYNVINDIINLNKINTEKYYKSNKNIYSKINFILKNSYNLINPKTIKILFLSTTMYFTRKLLKKSFTSSTLPKEFLILGFGCICNAYNYDVSAARYCIGGEITTGGRVIPSLVESNLGREKTK